MSNVLRVIWTIVPQITPQPWLNCNRCGGVRPFQSSHKIRANANGKRVDAWLIYKCVQCENSWNRPLLERRAIREIDPSSLHALQSSDPEYVRRLAFDVHDLRRRSERVEEFDAAVVQKRVLSEGSRPLASIDIMLAVPTPTCLRTDRLLAMELGVSRKRVQELQSAGRLAIGPGGGRVLRRAVRDRMRIRIDVSMKAVDLERVTGNLDAPGPAQATEL